VPVPSFAFRTPRFRFVLCRQNSLFIKDFLLFEEKPGTKGGSSLFSRTFRWFLAGLIFINLLNTTVLDLPRLTLVTNVLLVLVALFFLVRLLKSSHHKNKP